MKENIESLVFGKIVENADFLADGFKNNFIPLPKISFTTALTASAALSLDLIFPNQNYRNFDIDLLFQLLAKRINKSKIIEIDFKTNDIFGDVFFVSKLNKSYENIKLTEFTADLLKQDINKFINESLIMKMSSLTVPNSNKFYPFNSFISFFVYPLINTINNSETEISEIIKKLETNTFFIDNKVLYRSLLPSIHGAMIRNHTFGDLTVALRELNGTLKQPDAQTVEKNCYIATVAYGNIEHPNVECLRNYRDYKLSKSIYGRLFIKFYYKISPKLSVWIEPHKKINQQVKKVLDKIVIIISKIN